MLASPMLRRAAAACSLAKEMYEQWHRYRGITPRSWKELEPSTKGMWVDRAQRLCESFAHPRVVGRIDAETPQGYGMGEIA